MNLGSAFLHREKMGEPCLFSGSMSRRRILEPEVFVLNHLTTPGGICIYHIPKQFSSHCQILDLQISNLQSSFHPRHFNFLPADKSKIISSTIFPSLLKEGSQHTFYFCDNFGRSQQNRTWVKGIVVQNKFYHYQFPSQI